MTFTQVYAEVVSQRCAPCHTTADGYGVVIGKLDMTSRAAAYANLVNARAAGEACAERGGARVVPGDPDASLAYLKISLDDPAPCGEKMPLGGPALALTRDEADAIESWIRSGARDD